MVHTAPPPPPPPPPPPNWHAGFRVADAVYDAVGMAVSQRLGRKCSVPAESCARDLLCANPSRDMLVHSCFYTPAWYAGVRKGVLQCNPTV